MKSKKLAALCLSAVLATQATLRYGTFWGWVIIIVVGCAGSYWEVKNESNPQSDISDGSTSLDK